MSRKLELQTKNKFVGFSDIEAEGSQKLRSENILKAAIRRTPTGYALGMSPLDLLVMYMAETTAYRLVCQAEWN